jgi:hypothetical protein
VDKGYHNGKQIDLKQFNTITTRTEIVFTTNFEGLYCTFSPQANPSNHEGIISPES